LRGAGGFGLCHTDGVGERGHDDCIHLECVAEEVLGGGAIDVVIILTLFGRFLLVVGGCLEDDVFCLDSGTNADGVGAAASKRLRKLPTREGPAPVMEIGSFRTRRAVSKVSLSSVL
jgi:hypothetical protein